MSCVREANEWRDTVVSVLVRACFSDEATPINAAALPLRIRCAFADEKGFRTDDLRFHRDRLIDRADQIEAALADKAGRLARCERAEKRLTADATADVRKARHGGDAVSASAYKAAAQAAAADLAGLRAKIEGMRETVTRMTEDVDALRGASALISEVIDSRINRKTEALPTGAGVVVAVSEGVTA